MICLQWVTLQKTDKFCYRCGAGLKKFGLRHRSARRNGGVQNENVQLSYLLALGISLTLANAYTAVSVS